jgi:hypothetical protein
MIINTSSIFREPLALQERYIQKIKFDRLLVTCYYKNSYLDEVTFFKGNIYRRILP